MKSATQQWNAIPTLLVSALGEVTLKHPLTRVGSFPLAACCSVAVSELCPQVLVELFSSEKADNHKFLFIF